MNGTYHGGSWGEDCFDGGAADNATAGWVDPLLFLPAIAEPHADHLLLHVQLVRDHGNLLRGRFLVLLEMGKETGCALSVCEVSVRALGSRVL